MTSERKVVVLLNSDAFEKLAAEAERRAVPPAGLARDLVIDGLNGTPAAPSTGVQDALAALDWLAALRARLPGGVEFDAARLVREGRDEFDPRAGL